MVLKADHLKCFKLFIKIENDPVALDWKPFKKKISQILLRLFVTAASRSNFDTQESAYTQDKIPSLV